MTRPEEARAAEEAGASYVGAVLVPGSPRCLTPTAARSLARAISVPLVVVLADLGEEEAARAAQEAGAGVIQLHGNEPATFLERLRELGSWELWKAVRVRGEAEIESGIASFGTVADLLLLDGWHPAGLGGMGARFPWEALDPLRGRMPDHLRLGAAGGLSPENVEEAVVRLRPDLVDVSSGVETSPGRKDPARVRAFVDRAQRARWDGSGS